MRRNGILYTTTWVFHELRDSRLAGATVEIRHNYTVRSKKNAVTGDRNSKGINLWDSATLNPGVAKKGPAQDTTCFL